MDLTGSRHRHTAVEGLLCAGAGGQGQARTGSRTPGTYVNLLLPHSHVFVGRR